MVMARPTKSLSLYLQCLGRVTRTLKGTVDGDHLADCPEARRAAIAGSAKPEAHVFDFVGAADRFASGLVNAVDALAGKVTQEVVDYAKALIADAGRALPVKDALARAEAELAFTRMVQAHILEEERRKKVTAEADYRLREAGGPRRETRAQGQGLDPVRVWQQSLGQAANMGRTAAFAVHLFKEQMGDLPPWKFDGLPDMPERGDWKRPVAELFPQYVRGR